jgi:hypothetical protein
MLVFSSELSSFSPDMKRITTYEHSFLLPHSVETMSMSSTKYGISCKDLIGKWMFDICSSSRSFVPWTKWPHPKASSNHSLGVFWIPDDTRTSLLLRTAKSNSFHMNP